MRVSFCSAVTGPQARIRLVVMNRHSAALTGVIDDPRPYLEADDRAFDALCRSYGAIRVEADQHEHRLRRARVVRHDHGLRLREVPE